MTDPTPSGLRFEVSHRSGRARLGRVTLRGRELTTRGFNVFAEVGG